MKFKSAKKPETFGKNRKCVICGATLSIYNQRKECFCHDYPKYHRPKIGMWNEFGSAWNGRKRFVVDSSY